MNEDAEYIMNMLYKLIFFLEDYERKNPEKPKGISAEGLKSFSNRIFEGLGMDPPIFESVMPHDQ